MYTVSWAQYSLKDFKVYILVPVGIFREDLSLEENFNYVMPHLMHHASFLTYVFIWSVQMNGGLHIYKAKSCFSPGLDR